MKIGVKFSGNTIKAYYNTDLCVQLGDFLVVDSLEGLVVAEVVEINAENTEKTSFVVACKLDLKVFTEEKRKQLKLLVLENKMYEEVVTTLKNDPFSVYGVLSGKSYTMKRLLKEHSKLRCGEWFGELHKKIKG